MAPTLPMTPARRAILAVGVPLALAVIAASVNNWVRAAVFDLISLDRVSFPVALNVPASGGHVHVTTSNANVTLRTGAGRQIRVRGSVSGTYTRPTFSHRSTAAGLNLSAQCRVQGPAGNCSLNAAITAPAGLPVAVSNSFGDLDARALRGTVALSDNSGDLDASGLAGSIRLDDSFGNLNVSGLSGNIRLAGNSGDITAAGLTGDTWLQDSFGNIMVTGLAAADVVASNQSGDITLTFSKVPRRVDVTDSFGNITLNLPPGDTAYRVSARTSFGSRTVSVPQATSATDVITVTDSSGDITIANQGGGAPPQPAAPPQP